MKKAIALALLLTISLYALGQSLTGHVIDAASRKPISMAACKLSDNNGKTVSYCITKSDGSFSLKLPAEAVSLTVSFLGYESIRLSVKEVGKDATIMLTPSGKLLPEAIVKAPPIQRSKDTLNYNVASFIGKEDKHLADVLKKMPGIEVSENGSISYQGKPISRFNIEGRNMLGGRYSLASQNMPAEAVTTVQIMENNQPVRALAGKEMSDQTTLNIKLKSGYKSKPFGEITAGGGGMYDALWDGKVSLFNISKKNQAFITAETNNIGRSMLDNLLSEINMADIKTTELMPQGLLSDVTIMPLPLRKERYTKNRTYSIGANHLFALSEYSTLILNLTFTKERINREDSSYHEYGGEVASHLAESNNLIKNKNMFTPTVKYELNADKVFLEDELKLGIEKSDIDNRLTSNGAVLDNRTGKRPRHIQNYLKMVLSGKQVYTLKSFARHYEDKEHLYSPISQVSTIRQTLLENSVSTGFRLLGNWLSLAYDNKYVNDTYGVDGKRSANEVILNTLTPKYSINIRKGTMNVELPLNLSTMKSKWNNASDSRFFLSPYVSFTYSPNALFTAKIGGSHSETTGSDPVMGASYNEDYRTRFEPLDHYGWESRWNANLSMSYQSILHLFTWYLVANASWTNSDHYYTYTYTDNQAARKPVWDDNERRMFYAITSLNKTITKKMSVKCQLEYNRTEMFISQNGVKNTFKSNIISVMANAFLTPCSWLSATYSATGNISWYDREAESRTKSLYNDLTVSAFPIRNLSIGAKIDHNVIEIRKGEYKSNIFFDVNLEYGLSKKLSLRADLRNILNQKTYINAGWSGLNYNYYSTPLRGRELMLYATFKI